MLKFIKERITEDMKSTIVAAFLSILISLTTVYGALKTTDITNTTKIQVIEKQLECVPSLVSENLLNKQKITSHEKVVSAEINSLKCATKQLQKTTNILTIRVSENTTSNHRVLTIVEKLDGTLNNLNITMARIDERLKTIEKRDIR